VRGRAYHRLERSRCKLFGIYNTTTQDRGQITIFVLH